MALDDYIAKSKIGKGGRGNNRGGRGTFYGFSPVWCFYGVFFVFLEKPEPLVRTSSQSYSCDPIIVQQQLRL